MSKTRLQQHTERYDIAVDAELAADKHQVAAVACSGRLDHALLGQACEQAFGLGPGHALEIRRGNFLAERLGTGTEPAFHVRDGEQRRRAISGGDQTPDLLLSKAFPRDQGGSLVQASPIALSWYWN